MIWQLAMNGAIIHIAKNQIPSSKDGVNLDLIKISLSENYVSPAKAPHSPYPSHNTTKSDKINAIYRLFS